MSSEVAKAHDQGRRVLIITHRIQLGEALCDRFGVDYVSEIRTSDTGGLLGYGVCVDSLHKDSQAHFNPNDWSNDVIIIDECDQVFWHLLNSTTDVAKRRVSILRNFKQLIQNVLGSDRGKIYLSSADVSDTDIKYILSLAGEYKVNPFVILNNYQPVSGRCFNYSGSNPKNLIAALDKAIATGGHHLLCCSAQKAKSKWGTQALEQRFRQKFPHLRILRIDSHSVLDPKHPAFESIAHLNEILTQYDLVIASPSLETGVSIDIKGHFDAVWGIFQGVQPVDSVRQMLARLRETVDRHIWVSQYGMGTVGNGATSIGGLLRSQDVATQANIALLSASDNDDYSFIDQNFQPESLQTWGKRGAVINIEMRRYQEFVLKGLEADGYTIIDADDSDPDQTKEVVQEVKAASKELYSGQCQGVSESEDVSDAELKKLQEKRVKTKEERYQQRKAELSRRYEIEVTPELVEKDDDGWYPQLRLHYYLTVGRQFLANRDSKRAKAQAEAGENAIWKPDFNKGQMLSSVRLLEKLNLLQLLTSGERLQGSSEAMQELKRAALENRYLIKTCLNVAVSEKLTPVAIAQKLLNKFDLRLSYVGRLGPRGKRESVYQFVVPDDGRSCIFEKWLRRNELADKTIANCLVSVTNNIELQTRVSDTHNNPQTSDEAVGGWNGLRLKLRQGLESAGSFYQELVSIVGEAVGVADGEPYWNGCLGQWQVWVNFADGCKSVVCDWLAVV